MMSFKVDLSKWRCTCYHHMLIPLIPKYHLIVILIIALGLHDSSSCWCKERKDHLQLSKKMLDYELKNVMIKKIFQPLVWATKRLVYNMIEYLVHLISLLDLLRYLFDMPTLIRWLMRSLTKFKIQHVTQKSIIESIIANNLTSFLVSNHRAMDDEFPNKDYAKIGNTVR